MTTQMVVECTNNSFIYLSSFAFNIQSVTFPVVSITRTVDNTVITITGIKNGCNCSQYAIKPTEAGMNIIGMILIKKSAVSFTASSRSFFETNNPSIMTSPYILAGIGSGIR